MNHEDLDTLLREALGQGVEDRLDADILREVWQSWR